MNIKLSLIQTSQNRSFKLSRFITSLNNQKNINFDEIQYIFVDQEQNREVFNSLDSRIELTYVAINKHCSLSFARNIGLNYVKGRYVAFPDDDCWYDSETLYKVFLILDEGKYMGVSGRESNEIGILTNKFPNRSQDIKPSNQCGAISYTMFFYFNPNLKFDENIGVGSPYGLGSAEETDYMLTLMTKFNYKIKYDSSINIHHPILPSNNLNQHYEKSYLYARGMGYLLSKHKLPLIYILIQYFRPLIGAILFLPFKRDRAKKSVLLLIGRIDGFLYHRWILKNRLF